MSLGFLNPLFFGALAVLAVPLLVHLVARREARGTAFPSLMFLRRIPVKRTLRRTLRDRLLLGLRALALALLVLAFAGPYYAADDQPVPAVRALSQTVIALDRSYSMRFDGRWERALERARRAVADLPATAHAALVVFDGIPRTVAAMTGDRTLLQQALNSVRAGFGRTDYARALAHVPQLFDPAPGGTRTVLLISDLQRSGLAAQAPQLAQTVELAVETVAREAVFAPRVSQVQVLGSDSDATRVNLRASLEADAAAPDRALGLRVQVDGHSVEARALTENEVQSGAVGFSVVPARDRVSRVTVSLDQGLEHSHRLTLAQVEPIRTVLLTGEQASQSAVYLQQALALASQPKVAVRRVSDVALGETTLERADVLIIDDMPLQDSGAVADIERFVQRGGGLLTIAGEHPQPGTPLLRTALLPGKLGAEVPAGARLTEFNAHPALAGLGAEQLRNAPVWRRRALQPGDGDVVLARYTDGAVALAERQAGGGASILLSTGISGQWSALALEPGFAPLTIGLVRHLAGRSSGAGASEGTVGAVVDVVEQARLLGAQRLVSHVAGGGTLLVESPDGTVTKVSGSPPVFTPAEAGFYRVHTPGVAEEPLPLAANVEPRELQFEALSTAAFTARVARDPSDNAGAAPEPAPDHASLLAPWWFVLLTVATLLLFEGWYAARRTRARTA